MISCLAICHATRLLKNRGADEQPEGFGFFFVRMNPALSRSSYVTIFPHVACPLELLLDQPIYDSCLTVVTAFMF